MDILLFIAGIVLSSFVVWLIVRHGFTQKERGLNENIVALETEKNNLDVRNKVLEEKNADLAAAVEEKKQELEKEREISLQLNKNNSALESDYKNLLEKLNTQKEEIGKLQEKFTLQFRNLANDIFEEKSRKFTDQNRTNLNELLSPLKERIGEFEKKIDLNNKEALTWNTSLKEQINGLKELNLQITKEAENLTKALKGESKTQGAWGEFILESILEKSGLVRNREYFVQESFKMEDGRRYQPDVIIQLPEDKTIIIDAKASLSAYEKYYNSEDENEKAVWVKNHLLSIKTHIKNLSEKNYQKIYGLKALDFVLMFVPIEPALSLAIQHEQNLFNSAFEKNIVIVSPSTLLATLRTISSIWRQENQNRNALEIARQSGDLYDKFVGFVQDLENLGQKLDLTRRVYDDAMKKLSGGKGNLVKRAEKIKQLGANTSKALPLDMIERSDDA